MPLLVIDDDGLRPHVELCGARGIHFRGHRSQNSNHDLVSVYGWATSHPYRLPESHLFLTVSRIAFHRFPYNTDVTPKSEE